jgi:phage-related baseplate assembly protein
VALNLSIFFNSVVKPMSRTYIRDSFYSVYQRLGIDTSGWQQGHWMGAFTEGASIVLAALSNFQAEITRASYLALATGPWLTLKALDDYGVERLEATQATGAVQLTNGGQSSYQYDAGDVVFAHDSTGKNYRNSEAFTLGPGEVISVPIIAVEVGSESNASPQTVRTLVTSMSGVTCTNAVSVIGTDEESDVDLRIRCKQARGYWSAANPHSAYEGAVRDVTRADGTNVGITRAKAVPDTYGNVSVYCATASGEPISNDDRILATKWCQERVEPLGVYALVQQASAKTVTLNATVYATGDSSEVSAACNAAVVALSSEQQIGGTNGFLYRDQIIIALGSAHESIYHVVVASPSADVTLAANEYPKLAVSSLVVSS